MTFPFPIRVTALGGSSPHLSGYLYGEHPTSGNAWEDKDLVEGRLPETNYRFDMKIASTAATIEMLQRMIELRFPHLRKYVLNKPGTGGCSSRNAIRTTINAIVTTRAIAQQAYHYEMPMSTLNPTAGPEFPHRTYPARRTERSHQRGPEKPHVKSWGLKQSSWRAAIVRTFPDPFSLRRSCQILHSCGGSGDDCSLL
jgi:hypothetical protein